MPRNKGLKRIGEIHQTTKHGKIEIINCSGRFYTVKFEDGIIKDRVEYQQILKGYVGKYVEKIGERYTTREGYEIEVIECESYGNCKVRFLYNGIEIDNLSYQQITQGKVKNPYHRSVCGVGYTGIGKYKSYLEGKLTLVYKKWHSMLVRSYSNKYQEKFPTYLDVKVCEEWHNFQVFGEWFENNYESHMDSSWELDKDIICSSCKIYSPSNCLLVPKDVNTFFIKSEHSNGVVFNPDGNKYRAYISKFNKIKWLGSFSTKEEAKQVSLIEKRNYINELIKKHPKLDERVIIKLKNI